MAEISWLEGIGLTAVIIVAILLVCGQFRILVKALYIVLFLSMAPLLYVLMIFDHKRLRQTAESIEPLKDEKYIAKNKADKILQIFLLYVVRPILILLVLPCIVLWGGFLWLIDHEEEEDNDDDFW